MAYLGDNGDTSGVDDSKMNTRRGSGRELEEGWYRAMLDDDSAKDYSWGFGLKLVFKIIDGDFANRHIFDFLCLRHDKEETEKIARLRLRELAFAAGHPNPDNVDDTKPLFGRVLMVRVYRDVEKNEKYAESDGKRPCVGEYLSVKRWKEERSDEPRPGCDGKPAATPATAKSKSKPATQPAPAPYDDSEIPF